MQMAATALIDWKKVSDFQTGEARPTGARAALGSGHCSDEQNAGLVECRLNSHYG
jgi:hypothetical protein